MSLSKSKQILLLSFLSTASVSAAILTPVLPIISAEFNLALGQVNQIVSIFLLGYVIGQLIYGPLANRFGQLTSLRSGLVLNLIGILLSILACSINNYYFLLFSRLITALGAASGLCCTFALMSKLLNEQELERLSAYTMLSFTLGSGVAIFLGGILSDLFGWHTCLYLLLGYGAIQLIGSYQLPEPNFSPKPLNTIQIFHDYLALLTNYRFVSFAIILGFVSSITYGYSAAAPFYTSDILHLSSSQYGYWNLFNICGMISSSFLSAKLISTIGSRKTLFIGLSLVPIVIVGLIINYQGLYHSVLAFFTYSMIMFMVSGLVFPAASFYAMQSCSDKANGASIMSFINMASATTVVMLMGVIALSPLLDFIIILTIYLLISFSLAAYNLVKPSHKVNLEPH